MRTDNYINVLSSNHDEGFVKHIIKRIASAIVGMPEDQAKEFLASHHITLHVRYDVYGNTHNDWGLPEDDRHDRVIANLENGIVQGYKVG